MSTTYPWIKDSQYVSPPETDYLAITSPNGLYSAGTFNIKAGGSGNVNLTTPLGVVYINRNLANSGNGILNAGTINATSFVGALTGNATTATNITGGTGGEIFYQSGINTTAKSAVGTTGQYLRSNGTLAPSWVSQNLASSPSGLLTTLSSSTTTNQTLTINFNSSFSSVTNYTVNFIGVATTTQIINNYALSGGVTGGQYNVVIQLFCSGGGTTTWTFNGTGLASTQKSNFSTISTTAMSTGTTKYVVLTFAFDGTNYFLSGSNFS